MTDRELALALAQTMALEERARQSWDASRADLPENDRAVVVMRHATALRKSIGLWIEMRAVRAALVRS